MMIALEVPGHTLLEESNVAVGNCSTLTVVLEVAPVHPLRTGVTTYWTVPLTAPVFVSVWLILVPVPLDDPLAFVAVWVQLNVAPAGVEVKFKAVALPEQTDGGPAMVAVGVGFTVSVKIGDMGP